MARYFRRCNWVCPNVSAIMSRSPHGSSRHARRAATISTTREQLSVEKLVAGGSGFSRRVDGEPVFIRGALPGDIVEVTALTRRKGYSDARSWTFVSPSPDRRPAPCVYARHCGGCDLMELEASAQRRAKHELVLEILRRTGRISAGPESATPLTWGPSREDEDLGYRNRIRLHVNDQGQLGFLAEQSHIVVPIARCLVATERVNQVLMALVALSEARPELFVSFAQVEVRALGEVPDLTWVPRSSRGNTSRPPPDYVALLETIERHLQAHACGDTHLVITGETEKRWRHFVQGVDLRPSTPHAAAPTPGAPPNEAHTSPRLWFAPGTFTQVNWQVNQHIIGDLLEHVGRLDVRRFLDLYCGAGNFSLPLLAQGFDGAGVESNPTAIAAALAASTHQRLGGRFWAEDVQQAVERLIREGRTFDLILADPPRAGFKDVAPLLRRLAPKHLFVCACDPVTFARDLRCLTENGFELQQLKAYDMFPQTHHVECTAWLSGPTG